MAASAANGLPECRLGVEEVCKLTPHGLFVLYRNVTVCGTFAAMLAFVVSALVHRCRIAIPESLLVVILGAVLGVFLYTVPFAGQSGSLDPEMLAFSFDIVLKTIALPLIIFEAGWSLRLRDFVSQFGYIMLFAIVGTIISVIVVACLMKGTSHIHGVTSPRACVAYASLISSVDPVATLATFGALNVDPLLFILVFGESQINDAVAITLFETVNRHDLQLDGMMLATMSRILFGSIGLGLGLAVLYLLIMRMARMGEAPSNAILFLYLSSMFTYSLGESIDLSGIITVLFNAIVIGAYAPCHLGPDGTSLASFLFKQAASLCDTLIFLFCGVTVVFIMAGWGELGMIFGLIMSVICMIGRFFAIVPLGLLSNGIKKCVGKKLPAERRNMISPSHLFMMWHSGLRGGVSLVLAMEMGEWVDEENGAGTKTMLINGTLTLIVVYLLIFGSTTGFCLRCLGLPLGDEVDESTALYKSDDKHGYMWRALTYGRQRYFTPLLVGRKCMAMEETRSSAAEPRPSGGPPGSPHAPPTGTLPGAPSAGILSAVLRAARDEMSRPEFGSLQRRRSSHHLQGGGSSADVHRRHASFEDRRGAPLFSMHSLFGTSDPAHVENVEDAAEDLGSGQILREVSEESSLSDDTDEEEGFCDVDLAGAER